uniref:Uncharacterized protein n=1 Tax=Meloidogyne enterolobii TaxID=390850 RepID=A0A6V7UCU4_MELEN|nr:unnamed protein product [Meloidogyne enterolobii]
MKVIFPFRIFSHPRKMMQRCSFTMEDSKMNNFSINKYNPQLKLFLILFKCQDILCYPRYTLCNMNIIW